MKIKTKTLTFIALISYLTIILPTAMAASQDECAIWICLPGGFPSGCGGALSAMTDRIKKFQDPLPGFSSCAVNNNPSNIRYVEGTAARMGGTPTTYIRGTICRKPPLGSNGDNSPRGCVATVRYVDVLVDGKLAGDTFYW